MDLRRLRIGEWATGVAGLVLLISLFLPWYGVPGASATGFESLSVIDVVLTLVALAAMAVVPITASRDTPSAPLIYQALTWIPAAIGALLAVIRLIDVPVDGVSLRFGAWLGAAAAIAVVVGILVAMRDERLSDPGAPTDATGVPLDAVPDVELLPAPPGVNFHRLLRADLVVMVAALALLLVMAMDWYSTETGNEARRIEALSKSDTGSRAGNEAETDQRQDARFAAESAEKNAWQEDGLIDRLILIGLLGTVILAIAAAWMRAGARRFEPPSTPSTAVALVATATALLVVYRIIQEPGLDDVTVVKAGAPLAVALLAVIALAARVAMGREEDGTAWETPLESPADDRP